MTGKGATAPRAWYLGNEREFQAREKDLNWLQAMFISELLKQNLSLTFPSSLPYAFFYAMFSCFFVFTLH
jgi:hypothetical protein